jgi:anaerobic magnesium-protoporphyrin IX monomethyl ester cyclase
LSVDLLLVNPLFLREDRVESQLMTPYFPLGILYVAAVARDAGYTVAVFDAMFAAGDADLQAALERFQPRVVGLGVLATVRGAALRLAKLAKRAGALVLVGGADPTARPGVYLGHREDGIHPVDVVVVGEAEDTILELLPLLLSGEASEEALGAVSGMAYRSASGAPVTTPRRPLIEDIDHLPLPARDLIDVESYRRAWRSRHPVFSLSLIATRGCPYGCAWCQKIVFGRSFRPRSPERVAEEMRLLKEQYRPDQLRIVDDVMGIDRKWLRRWHAAVLAKDAVIPFECLSRADLVDEEMARLLSEAGCVRIAFGAESGSQRVLDAMTKGITVEQIYRAADICRAFGIETYFYMMVGYPGEEWPDLKLSVKLIRETRPDLFSTTIAYPLPGTPFYDQVRDQLPESSESISDWDYTAENRLLFQGARYNTAFYRRVIRWFHSEWKDARYRCGVPATPAERLRTWAGLWRDRLWVSIGAAGMSVLRLRPRLRRR